MQLPVNFSRKSLPVILLLLALFLLTTTAAYAQSPSANISVISIRSLTTSVCEGQPAVLSGGSLQVSGFYQWKVSAVSGGPYVNVPGGSGAHSNTYTSDPLVAGTWFFVLTSGPGDALHVSNEVTVTVHALPLVHGHASATSVCNGTPVSLCGHGAVSYTWSGDVADKEFFSPTASLDYILTGTDANGCKNSDTVTVSVKPLPEVVAHVSDNIVNGGSSVKFSGSGAKSYTWSNGVSDNASFVPSATETYVVTGVDENGCKNSDVITVFVKPAQ